MESSEVTRARARRPLAYQVLHSDATREERLAKAAQQERKAGRRAAALGPTLRPERLSLPVGTCIGT